MLGWVHQPAGTQSGSPGRAVGGPRRLGCRVNVKCNRTAEQAGLGAGVGGGVQEWDSGALDKLDWARGSPEDVCGPGLAKGQCAEWGAV